MKRMLAIVVISLIVAQFARAQAPAKADQTSNKVDGTVTVEGNTFKLNYVYANLTDSPNDKRATAITLYFSDKPVDRKDIDSFSKLDAKSKANGAVLLKLSIERGKLYGAQVVHNGETLMSGGFPEDSFEFKPDILDATNVKGSALTKKTIDWFGKKYVFRVSFNAALRKNEWTGSFYTPTPTNLGISKASGKLVIDGKLTKLNHVYATETYDPFDEKNNKVKLTFTETPVPQEMTGAGNRLFDMKKAGNAYVLEIELSQIQEPDKSLDATVWPLNKLANAFDPISANFIFRLESELVKFDTNTVEGRIYTLKPVEWSDRTYELDLSFNAAIKEGANAPVTAKNGKPLPAGGGDPARAFLKYMTAVQQAKDYDELNRAGLEARRSSDKQELRIEDDPRLDTPAKKKEAMQKMFELAKAFSSVDGLIITGGFIAGDRATLAFTGSERGYEVVGRVNMYLENGQWKQGGITTRMGNKIVRAKAPAASKPPATGRTSVTAGKPPVRGARSAPAPPTSPKSAPLATANGTVLGTFNLNGKPVRLKYVYARRRDAKLPDRSGVIDLFITDQPVPEEIFAKVYADKYHVFYLANDYFKGTSITGVYIAVEKGRCCKDKVSYFMTVMSPEGYLGDSAEFTTFNLQSGALRARAESKRDGDGMKWSYALNLTANLGKLPSQGPPRTVAAIKSTTALPPEEGKATGNLKLKANSYNLKYAYSWKERIFFDEPDERIYVLMTEGPVPRDKKIFEDSFEMGMLIGSDKIRGIELIIDPSGVPLQSSFLLKNGTLSDSTQKTELKEFRIENGRVKGRAEYKGEDGIRTYSVTFDAPLKN